MTDKVQKIREEVEKLMYGYNLEADIASCEDAKTEELANIKYQLCKKILEYIDSLPEEPVSEDLEKAAIAFSKHFGEWDYAIPCFKEGAIWQKAQFEKNRLKHCNNITNEQAELESDFIDQHLDKHQRMPTFLDAIEYGMQLQKEQMMKDVINTQVVLGPNNNHVLMNGLFNSYKYHDKVKVALIKED